MRQSNLNRNLCKNILDRASDSTFRNASVNLFFVYVFASCNKKMRVSHVEEVFFTGKRSNFVNSPAER